MYEIFDCRHGKLVHFSADRTIGLSLRLYGEWAEAEIFLISNLVRPGDVVVDVGANIGTHSLALSRMVGPAGEVISIDGQKEVFQLLSANMLINSSFNVRCINSLVASSPGMIDMPRRSIEENPNYGEVSFVDDVNSKIMDDDVIPISVISLDSLRLSKCNFIKVDVEDMEIDVFNGATETIKKLRPAIYFEQRSEKNLKQIFEYFRKIDYCLRWHVSNPFTKNNYNGHGENIFGGTCEVNIVALPMEMDVPEYIISNTNLISEAKYNPVFPSDSKNGWYLPVDSYSEFARKQRSPIFKDENEYNNEIVILKEKYEALHDDRIKAQEIIEHLSRKIMENTENNN